MKKKIRTSVSFILAFFIFFSLLTACAAPQDNNTDTTPGVNSDKGSNSNDGKHDESQDSQQQNAITFRRRGTGEYGNRVPALEYWEIFYFDASDVAIRMETYYVCANADAAADMLSQNKVATQNDCVVWSDFDTYGYIDLKRTKEKTIDRCNQNDTIEVLEGAVTPFDMVNEIQQLHLSDLTVYMYYLENSMFYGIRPAEYTVYSFNQATGLCESIMNYEVYGDAQEASSVYEERVNRSSDTVYHLDGCIVYYQSIPTAEYQQTRNEIWYRANHSAALNQGYNAVYEITDGNNSPVG